MTTGDVNVEELAHEGHPPGRRTELTRSPSVGAAPHDRGVDADDGRAATGRRGEAAAVDRYVRAGYRVVARNWRCRLGEIDLVLARGPTLVVCEVKTRSGSTFGAGYEAVTWRKRAKVQSLAEAFLQESRVRPAAIRFDVASVALGSGGPQVELFEVAFVGVAQRVQHAIDVGVRREVIHQAGPQVRPAAQRRRRDPAAPRHLERALQPSWYASSASRLQRPSRPRPGTCRKQTTDRSGLAGTASKSSLSASRVAGARPGPRLCSISRPKPSVPRCFHENHSFSARNRRVPSNEYWYQLSGSSSGRVDR